MNDYQISSWQTKNSKALIIANATALTEQMQSFFSEIKDPHVPKSLTELDIIAQLCNAQKFSDR
ncbi:hypothetical protein [Nostoc sp.]|uniref:hypothetical protein n=1 Tax=Nostoc sp. TaxID=1180 RepID=UPI002FFB5EE1